MCVSSLKNLDFIPVPVINVYLCPVGKLYILCTLIKDYQSAEGQSIAVQSNPFFWGGGEGEERVALH